MKLYIGNISHSADENDIEQMFVKTLTPTSVKLIKDRYTGESRGFAFVEFGSREQGEEAIRQYDGQDLKGRPLKINEARERNEGKSQGRSW
jgi:RNA recognition motif-containing protein